MISTSSACRIPLDGRLCHSLTVNSSTMSPSIGKKDSLKARMAVNVLGIPALLWLIWMGGRVYALFAAAVVVLGLREYLILMRKGNLVPRPVPVYLASLAILAAITCHAGLWGPGGSPALLGAALTTILFLLIMTLQTVEVLRPSDSAWLNLSANTVGVLWIGAFGGSFILVRETSLGGASADMDLIFRLTLSLYLGVWVCDSMAYIMGKLLGKTRIIPTVSPNKTVFGAVSGLISAIVLFQALGSCGFLPHGVFSPLTLLVLGLITGGVGQLGDFVESRLKRDFGVKDSGNLLPGHGGVLDRFDSLLYVMPATYLFLLWFALP